MEGAHQGGRLQALKDATQRYAVTIPTNERCRHERCKAFRNRQKPKCALASHPGSRYLPTSRQLALVGEGDASARSVVPATASHGSGEHVGSPSRKNA